MPKGEKVKFSIEFPKSSPPFAKGRTGRISGPPEADLRANASQIVYLFGKRFVKGKIHKKFIDKLEEM